MKSLPPYLLLANRPPKKASQAIRTVSGTLGTWQVRHPLAGRCQNSSCSSGVTVVGVPLGYRTPLVITLCYFGSHASNNAFSGESASSQ